MSHESGPDFGSRVHRRGRPRPHDGYGSFVRNGNTSSGSVDIRAVLNWIRSAGWFGNITVGNVQFGYEITSSSGGLNFTTNGYSVSFA